MNYKFWRFIDEILNNISISIGNKALLNRTQADINNSPKDILIYEQLKHALNMTSFERKINETGAYLEGWNQTPKEAFTPATDPEEEAYRLQWLKDHNIDINMIRWTTEELILLHQYKSNLDMRQRMFDIVKAYHKSHFLMSIGLL